MSGTLAWAGLAAFGWLTLFQLLLAAGLPLGAMAWGGAHRVLPGHLRLASLASAVLCGVGAALMAQAAGLVTAVPQWVMRPALWAFAMLFVLSFFGNALSQSRIERWHGVPLTVLLASCCGGLALGL